MNEREQTHVGHTYQLEDSKIAIEEETGEEIGITNPFHASKTVREEEEVKSEQDPPSFEQEDIAEFKEEVTSCHFHENERDVVYKGETADSTSLLLHQ